MFSIHELLSGGQGSPSSTRNEPTNALQEQNQACEAYEHARQHRRRRRQTSHRCQRMNRRTAPKQSAPHKKSQRAESGCTTISMAIKPTTILNEPTLNHQRLPSKEDGHQLGLSKNASLVIKKTQPKRRSDLRESRHGGEPDARCSRSEGAQNWIEHPSGHDRLPRVTKEGWK